MATLYAALRHLPSSMFPLLQGYVGLGRKKEFDTVVLVLVTGLIFPYFPIAELLVCTKSFFPLFYWWPFFVPDADRNIRICKLGVGTGFFRYRFKTSQPLQCDAQGMRL